MITEASMTEEPGAGNLHVQFCYPVIGISSVGVWVANCATLLPGGCRVTDSPTVTTFNESLKQLLACGLKEPLICA